MLYVKHRKNCLNKSGTRLVKKAEKMARNRVTIELTQQIAPNEEEKQ